MKSFGNRFQPRWKARHCRRTFPNFLFGKFHRLVNGLLLMKTFMKNEKKKKKKKPLAAVDKRT